MKKTVTVLLMLLVCSLSIQAKEGKKISIFTNIGTAASDFGGTFIDLGANFQLSNKIYLQGLTDYYFDPYGEDIGVFSNNVYSVCLYVLYKIPLTNKLNFFAKGGATYQWIEVSVASSGIFSDTKTEGEIGYGIGGGIECILSDKWAMQGGVTYRGIFKGDSVKWLKIYGGISFGL